MRVLVCGGRAYGRATEDTAAARSKAVGEQQYVNYSLHGRGITEVIHGGAPGADDIAARWAIANGVKVTRVDAEWAKNGRVAGPMRNREMLRLNPDLVIAFPGGKGTANMIEQSRAAGVPVEVMV